MNAFLPELSPEGIQECTRQLEGVLNSHTQWLARLYETIICRLTPFPDDIAEDAHCRCHFGRWHHVSHHPALSQVPEFIEIGEIHREMHQTARRILCKTVKGEFVEKHEYSALLEQAFSLRKHVYALDAGFSQELGYIVQIEGLAATELGRSPESSTTTGRKENAYRPVPLECRVRLETGAVVKLRPNPSATLRHETRNRHGQKSPPKPPRLAVTADNAAQKNSGGCEERPQKPEPESQAPQPTNSPAKTTSPESRAGIGSPRHRQKAK